MNAHTSTDTATAALISVDEFDARMAFLSIADAHYHLVESGAENLDYGFGRVAEMFDAMFPTDDLPTASRQPIAKPKPRPTPEATIEAIMYVVRARGLAGLKEPAAAARLASCDDAARTQINRRIERLRAKGVIR